MIENTKKIKKFIFLPAVCISSFLTCYLFYQFGSNTITSIMFVIMGASIQVYQILSLMEYKNSVFLKRKKYNALIRYLFITVISCSASIGFGLKEIDKKIMASSYETQSISVMQDRISTIKSSAEKRKKSIDYQIEMLKNIIPNLTYNISERTIQINDEIRKLQDSAGLSRKESDEIMSIEKSISELSKTASTIKSSFSIIADVFHVDTKLVMVIFLTIITILLECMIYTTSSFNDYVLKLKKLTPQEKKVKKDKEIGQERLF